MKTRLFQGILLILTISISAGVQLATDIPPTERLFTTYQSTRHHSTHSPPTRHHTTNSPPTRYATLCPNGFLRLGHSCYYFSAEMRTWHEAYFDCRRLNGTLTTVESLWEDLTLRTYLNKPQLARLNRWIGGEYNWMTENWIWGSSGKPMSYFGFPPKDTPLGGQYQCVYLSPSLFYRWNFASCFTAMHYICKAPQERIPYLNF